MGNIKVRIKQQTLSAINSVEIDGGGYKGVTNLKDIIEIFGGVKLVRERNRGGRDLFYRNRAQKMSSTVTMTLPFDAWGVISEYLLSNFNVKNNQLVLPLFINPMFLDFNQFNLVDEYTDTSDGGNYDLVNFVPEISSIFYQVGSQGLSEGFYGDGSNGVSISRASLTSIKAKTSDVFNSKIFKFNSFDASGNSVEGDINATVSGGELNLSHTSAAGSYTSGYFKLDSLVFKESSESSALKLDLDIANLPGLSNVIPVGYSS